MSNKTTAERKHLDAVSELCCCVCRRLGYGPTPAEIHHPRRGTGMGQRASHFDALPMCFEHHRGNTGLHGLGTKGFARHYGFDEADLLADVRGLLAGA